MYKPRGDDVYAKENPAADTVASDLNLKYKLLLLLTIEGGRTLPHQVRFPTNGDDLVAPSLTSKKS